MDNAFGNSVMINVNCPTIKVVEQTVTELPKTGAGANIAFGASLLAVVTYFYTRSRQTGKEVKLIRRDFNTGTI
jgi:LPXTG-motif cell wall-anchored protein